MLALHKPASTRNSGSSKKLRPLGRSFWLELLYGGWPTQRGFRCVGILNFLGFFRDMSTLYCPTQAKKWLEWATSLLLLFHFKTLIPSCAVVFNARTGVSVLGPCRTNIRVRRLLTLVFRLTSKFKVKTRRTRMVALHKAFKCLQFSLKQKAPA